MKHCLSHLCCFSRRPADTDASVAGAGRVESVGGGVSLKTHLESPTRYDLRYHAPHQAQQKIADHHQQHQLQQHQGAPSDAGGGGQRHLAGEDQVDHAAGRNFNTQYQHLRQQDHHQYAHQQKQLRQVGRPLTATAAGVARQSVTAGCFKSRLQTTTEEIGEQLQLAEMTFDAAAATAAAAGLPPAINRQRGHGGANAAVTPKSQAVTGFAGTRHAKHQQLPPLQPPHVGGTASSLTRPQLQQQQQHQRQPTAATSTPGPARRDTDSAGTACRKSPSCVSFFSEDEKNQLALAARKAKGLGNVLLQEPDTNDEAHTRAVYEGQLYKYTNVVKGYQYRFFVLNRELGTFEYYMLEDVRKTRPRGAMHLAGAVISPSEEDGQLFTVSAACGEVYKLRAHDSRERQLWVNRLRSVAEAHTDSIGLKHPPLALAAPGAVAGTNEASPGASGGGTLAAAASSNAVGEKESGRTQQPPGVLPCPAEAFQSLQLKLSETNLVFRDLAVAIETLPDSGSTSHVPLRPTDPDLLLLKATSTATVICLEQCFSLLAEQRQNQRSAQTAIRGGGSHRSGHHHANKKLKKKVRDWAHQPFRPVIQPALTASAGDVSQPLHHSLHNNNEPGKVNVGSSTVTAASALAHVTSQSTLASLQTARSSGGEVSDDEVGSPNEDAGAGLSHSTSAATGPIDVWLSEEDKDAVLTLLGQLKLGTDLTRVSLPIFVQEPRSLLEVYADLFSYASLFVAISEGKTDEDRMLACVRWLLSALYATRRGTVARKPFNPVLGESFRCSFMLSRCMEENGNAPPRVTFVAEQVSHHPPKSALYVECLERGMKCEASIGVKAAFMNMFVGIELTGGLCVRLMAAGLDERYEITLPQMACRSLVSRPYFEFSGKMNIRCPQTGCSATISFPSKSVISTSRSVAYVPFRLPFPTPETVDPPFHGAKMHGVTIEMRNHDNNICLRGQGHWNESVSFSREAGDLQQHFEFNIRSKEQCRKRVRPLAEQDANESRRVWAQVSRALKQENFEAASGYHFQVEESHRGKSYCGARKSRELSDKQGDMRNEKDYRGDSPPTLHEPRLFRLLRQADSVGLLFDYEYKHAVQPQHFQSQLPNSPQQAQ